MRKITTEERLALVKSVGEEIVTEKEIIELFNAKKSFIAYDGFEPSGQIHIAQGILRAINVNKMIAAGATFNMLVADWHGWANNKLGGNLDNIQTAGKYLIEVWRLTGMDLKHVNFLWASDFVKDDEYWKKVMQIARNSTLKRIIRTAQIMGRLESEALQASQILYPCLQCADIFHQQVDVCQLGMDQRKVNMLAREVGPKLFGSKPVVVSHHMVHGLNPPKASYASLEEKLLDVKMSKSNPDAAIFMTDSESEIQKKIRKAYCPEEVEGNPILEYARYFIFEKEGSFKIERSKKFRGDIEFSTYSELESAFLNKEVHPADLKRAVAFYLNKMVDPVRKAFEANSRLRELRDQVLGFEVTR
ncbi:MAG: tyrosine--tRNA ligase [Candidatus Heimdallarchaeota archaeon]|nr:MAG: tyrosine--tRNA ligase [Candidatus Heimdallarchaeota archaeon]